MSAGWKQEEREVGKLLGGSRYHANTGGDVDVESDEFVVQVKHRRTMSLAEVEREAVTISEVGRKSNNKLGVLVVKRKAGRGTPTPRLIIMTEETWKRLRDNHATLEKGINESDHA